MTRLRIAIVDGHTQSRKTWKTFEVVRKYGSPICVFVTQANNSAIVTQVLQRARSDLFMCDVFQDFCDVNFKSKSKSKYPGAGAKTRFLCGYWHDRTRKNVLDVLDDDRNEITVVFDECDAGGARGLLERLCFVSDLHAKCGGAGGLNVVFVTATVANLCKSFLTLSGRIPEDAQEYLIVQHVLKSKQIEHYYVHPAEEYVGPSWFIENDAWMQIRYPKRAKDNTEWERERRACVLGYIGNIPHAKKRLVLIGVASRCDEQDMIGQALLDECGFNVCVLLNSGGGGGGSRNYIVYYASYAGVAKWELPYSKLESAIRQGHLDYINDVGTCKKIKTGIAHDMSNITLAHVLQAALIMGTESAPGQCDMSVEEWLKLVGLHGSLSRPENYPCEPRIALVSGNMIGRGVTIQNPMIGFVCSAFVFTDTNDGAQRGAPNAQKLGRACGMLRELYVGDKMPMLVATEKVLKDALINEMITHDKGSKLEQGKHVSLASFVSEDDWKEYQKVIKDKVRPGKIIITKKKKRGVEMENSGIQLVRIKSSLPPPKETSVITSFRKMAVGEFLAEYGLAEMPGDAVSLAGSLPEDCNVSYKESSAQQVANLANYFKHPNWAGRAYHIVFTEPTWVVVIRRNIEALHTLKKGKCISGHNEHGVLVHYMVA